MDDAVEIETEIVIAAPLEAVFSWLLDVERLCDWADGVIEASWTEAGPIQVGSTYHQVFQLGGRLTSAVGEVLEYDPPHRLVSMLESRNIRSSSGFTLETVPDGTRVRFSQATTVRGKLAKLLFPMMRVKSSRRMATTFAKLKQLIEAEQAAQGVVQARQWSQTSAP